MNLINQTLNMEQMYSDNTRPKKSKALFYIIIAIVVLLVIYWLFTLDFGAGTPDEEISEIAPGEILRTAPEGQLVSGFPEGLILEEGVVAEESYSIDYSEAKVDQPVVTYVSSLTLEQNIDLYGAYLRNNNWNITHEATLEDAPVTFFYARKDNRDVNIVFDSQGESVKVSIALAVRESAAGSVDEDSIDPGTPVAEEE